MDTNRDRGDLTYREESRGVHIADLVALILVIVGGLNWLTIGLFDWNFVNAIFGAMRPLERAIYVIVGIAAVYTAVRAPAMSHLTAERFHRGPHPAA